MAARTLSEWLEYIERIHPKSIELGLDRVLEVKRRLALELAATIVTVAGTNGKDRPAPLESILLAAGYRVGLYLRRTCSDTTRVRQRRARRRRMPVRIRLVEAARGVDYLFRVRNPRCLIICRCAARCNYLEGWAGGWTH
jgi:dihydrofolate synthase/folylpolyglutamate synthase